MMLPLLGFDMPSRLVPKKKQSYRLASKDSKRLVLVNSTGSSSYDYDIV